MKRLILLIIFVLPLSCYNGLNDMYDKLGAKDPVCVNLSAVSGGNGRGWVNAYNDLNTAIASADAGDEIWVANTTGTSTISSSVIINKSVALYGGFNGSESRREERNSNNKSLIKGGTTPQAILVSANNVFLDSFKIEGMSGTVRCITVSADASLTINNCSFLDNTISIPGAAIYIESSSVEIISSEFDGNDIGTFINGGAINAQSSKLIISNSLFKNNKARLGGAVTMNGIGSILEISNTFFQDNTASDSGGAVYSDNAVVSIKISEFNGNTSTSGSGGAIYVSGSDVSASAVIDRCEFSSNSCGQQGGGVYLTPSGKSSITNTFFFKHNASTLGGALFAGGNVLNVFFNNTFYFNHGENGGGAAYFDVNSTIYNSVFYSNSATTASKNNIYTWNKTVSIVNSFYYGGVFTDTGAINSLLCITGDSSNPFLSIIKGESNFLYPADMIVDKGDNTVSGITTSDLAGNSRIVDMSGITNSTAGSVDLGCFERQ